MYDYTKATPLELDINKAAYEAGLNGTKFEMAGYDNKNDDHFNAWNWGKAYGERKAHNIKMGWA